MIKRLLKRERQAFTLAEVLITLGIIGVVAAVTMPTLVKNYQEKAWTTSSQVFVSKFNNALKVMNTQGVLGGLGTTENFVAELGKHMKIMKTCNNNDLNSCLNVKLATMIDYDQGGIAVPVDANTSIKTAHNLGLDWGTNVVGFVLANGQSALVAYNPNCVEDTYNNQFVATSCVAGLYDVNGLSNPNATNKDVRTYGNVSLNSSAAIKFNGKLWKAPVLSPSITRAYCQAHSSELGITCCSDSDCGRDYWVGTVDLCGGMQNMPTQADVDKIRQVIYTGYSLTGIDKMTPFTSVSGNNHPIIWLQGDASSDHYYAPVADFRGDCYYYVGMTRYSPGIFSVCRAN